MAPHKIELVSVFPPGYFLENIETVAHGGLLVTVPNRSEIYYVPPSFDGGLASPMLLQTFAPDQMTFGVIRAPQNPNVFYLLTGDFLAQGSGEAHLRVLDMSDPTSGSTARPIMTFPAEAAGLNGLCALSDSVLLAADSFASRIWRIDLDVSSFPPKTAKAATWCSHETMAGKLILPDFQPGVNGVKYSPVTGCVYYTSTQLKLFCRVAVDKETLQPSGDVEVISRGMQGDDMVLDDEASPPVAYVTTHRDNTILRTPLNSTGEIQLSDLEVVMRGTTEDDRVVGPTAGAWEYDAKGKIAYFTADGGLKNPLSDGIVRCGKVVRVTF